MLSGLISPKSNLHRRQRLIQSCYNLVFNFFGFKLIESVAALLPQVAGGEPKARPAKTMWGGRRPGAPRALFKISYFRFFFYPTYSTILNIEYNPTKMNITRCCYFVTCTVAGGFEERDTNLIVNFVDHKFDYGYASVEHHLNGTLHYHFCVGDKAKKPFQVTNKFKVFYRSQGYPLNANSIKTKNVNDFCGLVGYIMKDVEVIGDLIWQSHYDNSFIEDLNRKAILKKQKESRNNKSDRFKKLTPSTAVDHIYDYIQLNQIVVADYGGLREVIKKMRREGYSFINVWSKLKAITWELMTMLEMDNATTDRMLDKALGYLECNEVCIMDKHTGQMKMCNIDELI